MCTTLKNDSEGCFITSRGYRQSKARGMSARELGDTALLEHLRHDHTDNYSVYGVGRMWHALRHEENAIGRERAARLMCSAGLFNYGKGDTPVATRKSKRADLCPEIVEEKSQPLDLTGCEWQTLPMHGHENNSCAPLLSPMCSP